MAASFTIAHVRGIPIRLHVTFLLVLPIFAYLMAAAYFGEGAAWPGTYAWLWGSLLAVGLFGSVLLHELAHSLMALRSGVKIRHITLLPIGGVSAFEEVPQDPGKEFKISIVGPLTNIVIGLPVLGIWALGVPEILPMFPRFVFFFAVLNLVVGGFNLLVPAFPMDGGRILRAALSRPMGRVRATRVAASVGRGVAIAMGLYGFLVGGWILILIAVFVYLGARQEEGATLLTSLLGRFHVEDLMTHPVDTVPAGASVEEAYGRMLGGKRVVLPVVEADRAVGVVRLEDVQAVPAEARPGTPVDAILRREFRAFHPWDDAEEASRLLSTGEPGLVLDREDRLVGIVTPADVVRIAQIAGARQGPAGRGRAGPLG